ncbi:hypothetical protein ACHAXT_004379 [Thalassiosira profunda]
MDSTGNTRGDAPTEPKSVDHGAEEGADQVVAAAVADMVAIVEAPAVGSKANEPDGPPTPVQPPAEKSTEGNTDAGMDMEDGKKEEPGISEGDTNNAGMEADKNNEDGKADRRASKRMRTSLSDSRFEPGEGGGLASKKPKVDDGGATPSTEAGIDMGSSKDGAPAKGGGAEKSTGPSYRWIGAGETRDDIVVHQGVEITLGDDRANPGTTTSPFIVRPGDVVMLSSGEDAKQPGGPNSGEQTIYNDPASREAGLGSLDPFIGKVERLWEAAEGQQKKGRMIVRVRWFFKKEDIEGLKGVAISARPTWGDAKENIVSTMGPHDLVLTDRSDDNSVSTILRKVHVIRSKPLESREMDVEIPKGNYVCRYDLSFSGTLEAAAELHPYNGSRTKFGSDAGTQRRESKDMEMSDPTSTDDEVVNNHYAATMSPFPMSPRRVISEGPTVGSIKVGAEHQADIPPKLDLERKTSFRGLSHPPSQRIPTMVWDPATDDDEAVDNFLDRCSSVIVEHLKSIELEPFHDVNYVESPSSSVEERRPREASMDLLLTELHDCRGDADKAIQKVAGNPEKYTSVWTKDDKEQYDTGYRTYRESIRMVATLLEDSKSCKDTVDYYYRFKLVENFRRFKRKKRDKSLEVMATVEDRMLNEKAKEDARKGSGMAVDADGSSSDEEEEGKVAATINENAGSSLMAMPTTHVGPVNNRVRTWFRTAAGGEDAVGATQQRRNGAADLLSEVGQRVGKDAFATLVSSLKACNASQANNSTLVDVKSTARDVLEGHPDLLEQFLGFLPRQVRTN